MYNIKTPLFDIPVYETSDLLNYSKQKPTDHIYKTYQIGNWTRLYEIVQINCIANHIKQGPISNNQVLN